MRIDACEAHCIDPMFFHDTSRILLCMHAAAPPISVMKSRRFTAQCLPCFQRKGYQHLSRAEGCCAAAFQSGLCRLRVIRVDRASDESPLVPRFRTSETYYSSDAKCQKLP